MGKNQHSKDRMFLTRTEHASGEHRGAGKQSALKLPYKTLPFDCCAISFRPFENPLCTGDGIVFELLNIVPYLKKYKRHPVTGRPLAASDLIKLHFHKSSGVYACPVLFKPFTQHSHIVAIKTTGNVYSYDAVKQMNLKTGHLHDLLDDTPFSRADVIHIQDPSNGNLREMEHFSHVSEALATDVKDAGGVRHTDATARIMGQVAERSASGRGLTAPKGAAAAVMSKPAGRTVAAFGGGGGGGGLAPARWTQTTGRAAASLTSTSMPVATENEIAPLTDEESARQRYAFVKSLKTKAYVALQTSHGALNLELHCDSAPMTCDNFLQLLSRGYYDGTPFHRLIKSFMIQARLPRRPRAIPSYQPLLSHPSYSPWLSNPSYSPLLYRDPIQGGDPTGTGSGGESAFGKPFKDEISNKLKHEGRGVLAMANSGPGTNGSQFYITFKSATHLDGKHTVFGRVVGGLDTLGKLEGLPTDKEDRPTAPVTPMATPARDAL